MEQRPPETLNLDPAILKRNPWNSNFLTPDREEALDRSVKRLKVFKPLLARYVDGEYQIIGGQHRSESCVRLGLATVPVFVHYDMDEETARAIGIVDNERYGMDDETALAENLKHMSKDLIGVTLFDETYVNHLEKLVPEDTNIDFDLGNDPEAPPSEPTSSKAPQHVSLRVKLGHEQSDFVNGLISRVVAELDLDDDEKQEINAGVALHHICTVYAESN